VKVDSRVALLHSGRQVSAFAAAVLWAVILLSLAPGVRGESAVRPQVDEDPTGAPYVAGELLVVYESGTPEATEKNIVRESGGQTTSNLPGDMRLISLPAIEDEPSQEARERALERVLKDLQSTPRVEAADYNYIREALFTPNDPKINEQWGLSKARFRGAWDHANGSGARIAVVDSGVDQNHPDIGKIVAQYDFLNNDVVANDANGHGTFVTGIAGALTNNGKGVAGGCPDCELLIAKVVDRYGDTTDAHLVEGIEWSANNGADVVNLSVGGPAQSSVLEMAINYASARGAVVVAAAGNTRTKERQYPAAYPAAIAVSATTRKDELARFSSRGGWVDLAAPGVNILSTRKGGGYDEESGTSMSAPFVSAVAGLLASQGTMTADEIRQRMESTATDLGDRGVDSSFGHGRIDAASAVQ
jgi:thermitase